MRKIKSQNTQPKILLRKALWHLGIRYRLNVKKLPGKPDIYVSKARLVVFVDGEYWYGYNCDIKKTKTISNRSYWIDKIEGNIKRDNINNRKFDQLGCKVLRFWDHEIKNDPNQCVQEIFKSLKCDLIS